ncbi:restriction endonuclease subunit S [[Clostridium] fimetarium]|uniref:Type I restriction enzyme, S subunit n=1 Tax=[Clostridium] fimetarium TaxID=99656 RepID=A0A1I0M4L7_9FIRM|nr:restriction endonuclease subunit S [[Clostridium] fimetarium]SEV83058.1 type I restriction enzyme, S subunit [[Clostridium] fimetarium]
MREYYLEDLFELQMGKTPARENSEYWNNGNNDWISIRDLSGYDKYVSQTKEQLTDLAITESGIKEIPSNTVVMSFKLSIGKLAITTEKIYSNEAIMALIDKKRERLSSDYLYYLLLSKDWNEGTNKAVMGKTLNKATLSKVKIKLHEVKEQENIVSVLDKANKLIILRKRQLLDLDNLIKSRFVDMFGDISTGQYKYETLKLGDIANVGSSHRVFTTEFVEEGIPFYRGTEIGELANGRKPSAPYYISQEHYKRLANDDTKPKVGDLLMPSICNKGQVWMVDTEEPFYYKDGRVLSISADREIYDTWYLQFFMKQKTVIEYPKLGSGSTFAEFKIFLLKDIDVLTPPRRLQEQFATFVQQVDNLKVEVQKSLYETQILFDSLMQQYFK